MIRRILAALLLMIRRILCFLLERRLCQVHRRVPLPRAVIRAIYRAVYFGDKK